ncbi:MAG: peptidoglycan-binding protein [Rhodoglobus sp.]|nr:peptidoglycan-binding protein [Rhodoglobus sp.]
MKSNESGKKGHSPPPARWLLRAAWGLAILAVGLAVGWAATIVFTPPADVLDSTKFTFAEVVGGEVGASISLNTVAEWSPIPAASNLASGTVTTVNISAGQEVGAGTVLYTVNLRPIVIALGAIPAFESMASGSSGADVAQLQTLLTTLGYFSGPVDGNFGWETSSAVKDWQESLGLVRDGVVQPGDVVFVTSLPARVALDPDKISRGNALSGGEPAVNALPVSPKFTIPVTAAQSASMPIGTRVEITSPDGDLWESYVTEQKADDKGNVTIALDGKDSAPICGEKCGSIPVSGQRFLHSQIVIVESVNGLTVPSAALLSKADGSIVVIDDNGKEHVVTVKASAKGISVIEGMASGARVRVPAGQ